MIVKNVIDEDFTNYKKVSMFIGFPHCTFKCEQECGMKLCQNSSLVLSPNIEITTESIVTRYLNNPITKSIVIGGLEPFDDFEQLMELLVAFRAVTTDDFVIYTGYNEDEIQQQLVELKNYSNVVVKFGRFIPDQPSHYDEELGVILASKNQYAKRIS